MENLSDTTIKPDLSRSPTDESVLAAMQTIKKYGMEPILKPHVDMQDD